MSDSQTPTKPAPTLDLSQINQPMSPFAPQEPFGQVAKVEPPQLVVPVSTGRAFIKLCLFFLIFFLLGSVATVIITKNFTLAARRLTTGTLYSQALKETLWQSFGTVSEAELSLPIETPQGIVEYPFLLDTGAVVSSLPREMADKLGKNLAFLPRQTFKGFGNTTAFAYESEMTIRLGSKAIKLPVVFTEAAGSRALLGRKGVFDKFTIMLDHKNRLVEIRE